MLEPATALEILAHRMLWSLAVVAALLLVSGGARGLRRLRRRQVGLLTLAAALVSVNWGTYIWGVNNGHVVETSLGYYINPLVTVLLGVVVLGERLRRVQWLAVAVAGLGVGVLTLDYGRPPWIALALAASFALYGLVKKRAAAGALEGLAVETVVMLPLAAGYLGYLWWSGSATFGATGPLRDALLVGAGIVTAVPLLLFGGATTRIPLTRLGLLQYVTPTLQLVIGLSVAGEDLPPGRLVGFCVVWASLAVFTTESIVHLRRRPAAGALGDGPAASRVRTW